MVRYYLCGQSGYRFGGCGCCSCGWEQQSYPLYSHQRPVRISSYCLHPLFLSFFPLHSIQLYLLLSSDLFLLLIHDRFINNTAPRGGALYTQSVRVRYYSSEYRSFGPSIHLSTYLPVYPHQCIRILPLPIVCLRETMEIELGLGK